MTIIDELLILLDDLGEAPASNLPVYFPERNLQVISSSLGRLVNRGWVAKKNRRSQVVYAISTYGVNELNRTLDAIKESNQQDWDRRWRLVIFDIPESKRRLRDQLRNFLRQTGFGQLKSSVWLTPWDKSEQLKPLLKRLNLQSIVTEFTTEPMADTYQSIQLAQQSWNWLELEKRYKSFLTLVDRELLKLKDNEKNRRFLAKKLVFQFAEVVRDDPCLPASVAPNATLLRRAYDAYHKIRPYCLS